MSADAATAARVASRMVQQLLDMGAVEHAIQEGRQRGLRGQLVVHVLSYADELACVIIDALREGGGVSGEVLSADKAYQQAYAMPGCLLLVIEAPASRDLVTALLPEACRSDVANSITMAEQLHRILLVVVAAGRVVAVMADAACTCAECQASRMSMGAAQRERQRRADRSRRLGR